MVDARQWVLGFVGLAIVWGEVVHWRASRALTNPDPGGPEAVVVFGYKNRHPDRPNALNRWRVRAALRSFDPTSEGQRLVVCGGSRDGRGMSEAALMAAYARQRGFDGGIALEDASLSTWENVQNAIPLIEDAHRLKFVSNPLHAHKARLYLHRQRPDLARRLVRAADYKVGEWAPLKPLFALYGLADLSRTRRS